MFSVYILKSSVTNKYYVGQTTDIEKRLLYHNSGYTKSTKAGIPWKLVYSENYNTRQHSMKREAEIKKYKSRIMIEKIIGEHLN